MKKDKSNILLFVCDDLRWDALSGMGHPQVETPNLDRFMKSGTAFTRCTMPGSTVGAVCMPSRAMVHTGRSLFDLEEDGSRIPEGHITLGEYFQRRGYDTFHTGKWHNGRESFARSFADGAALFFGGMGDQWNMPIYDFDPSGRYDGKIPMVRNPFREKEMIYLEGDRTTGGRHATEVFVEEASAFLGSAERAEHPFFLSVALTAPHDPRTAPRRFHELYPPGEIELPENFLIQHPHHTGALGGRDDVLAGTPRDPSEVREHISDYYAMISHLDEEFGKLLRALEKSGHSENTLVVFTADHGLAVGQHGLMGKQDLYEHSLRVPMILAGPRVPRDKRVDALVCHYDLFRTLTDYLEEECPESVTCRSLEPFLSGEGEAREELYLSFGDSVRGLLQGKWKLIEYSRVGYRATQLFDLDSDPDECFDRARDPRCRERLKAMRNRLESLGRETGDRGQERGSRFWSHWDSSKISNT